MRSVIKSIDTVLRRIQQFILVATGGFVTVAIGTAAMLRYLFRQDLYGAEEFITIAAFWMYFIGAVYAVHAKKHIQAEIFSSICKNERIVAAVKVTSVALTAALALLYTWWGWEFFAWSLGSNARSVVWQVPLVVGHTAVFVSFILMSIYLIVELKEEIATFRAALKNRTSDGEEAHS